MLTHMKYTFQALQKDNFWLPPALMALFLLIASMVGPEQQYGIARSFLGFVLPLLPGGLSAYAFLADPALELQFSTKRSASKMIFERLTTIYLTIVAVSILFQLGVLAMGISLAPLGGIWQRQFIWLVPCLTSLMLGAAFALLARNGSGGFALIGGTWMLQLIARGWFAEKPVLRNILLFYAAMDPHGAPRLTNQIVLSTLSLFFLVLTHQLLKKQERYL